MNVFFNRNYQYTVNASIESVRNDLAKIIRRTSSNNSQTISGELNENEFTFIDKWIWALLPFSSVYPAVAYMNGKLFQDENKTIIKVKLSPALGFILGFYFIPVIFFIQLWNSINRSEDIIFFLVFFPFLALIIFKFMQAMMNHLINSFESLMLLQHDNL